MNPSRQKRCAPSGLALRSPNSVFSVRFTHQNLPMADFANMQNVSEMLSFRCEGSR